MGEGNLVSFRLDEAHVAELEELARRQGRSRNFVARDWVIEALDRGRSQTPEYLAELVGNVVAEQIEAPMLRVHDSFVAVSEKLVQFSQKLHGDTALTQASLTKLREDLAILVKQLQRLL